MQGSTPAGRSHRKAKLLSPAVLDHVTVCLEEQLFSQAFSLLSSSLSVNPESNAPSLVPPPQHLALAVTIVVHPQFTTRTSSQDKRNAADEALRYLRQLTRGIDLTDGNIKEAFRFQESSGRSERSNRVRSRNSASANVSDDEQDKPGSIRSEYTTKRSLWHNAEDFWSVVGWAFNCSVSQKARWERWKHWLDLMLDFLEADLEDVAATDGYVDTNSTLIAQYLATVGDGRNNRRRIMRAILADGSKKSVAEFGEVFKDETKSPVEKSHGGYRPAKRKKLDLDNDEYGDYFDDDSDQDSPESASRLDPAAPDRRRHSTRRARSEQAQCGDDTLLDGTKFSGHPQLTQGVEAFGGSDSIRLRQRLLILLTQLSRIGPSVFMDTEELFSLFAEFLRPLPLALFQQFVAPLQPHLDLDLQTTLNEMLFQLITGRADNCSPTSITRASFEADFAVDAAVNASAEDNAKVSLLIESILRALWKLDMLEGHNTSLVEAIQLGIDTREAKVRFDGRKKSAGKTELHDEAWSVMNSSAERMKILASVTTG